MMKKNVIRVVFGVDNSYTVPLATAICSILKNLHESSCIIFYILDGGFSEYNKHRLNETIKSQQEYDRYTVKWLTPDLEELKKLPVSEGFNATVYLRLLIPNLLSDSADKVIYLDGDLIVEEDLTKLWNIELTGYALGAVQNTTIPYVSWPMGIGKYAELGLNPHTPYFNAGVLVMNLHHWRADGIAQKAMEYVTTYKDHLHLNDQEALNAVLRGAWKQLDSRWNQQPNIFYFTSFANFHYEKFIKGDYEALVHRPYIIHFCNRHKPWHYNCTHPFQHKFISYLKESGWFSELEYARFMGNLYSQRVRWMIKNTKQTLRLGKLDASPLKKDRENKFNIYQIE